MKVIAVGDPHFQTVGKTHLNIIFYRKNASEIIF